MKVWGAIKELGAVIGDIFLSLLAVAVLLSPLLIYDYYHRPPSLAQQQLQQKADSFLPLFDNMPACEIIILPPDQFHEKCEQRKPASACAYPNQTIYVSKQALEYADEMQVEEMLKHELTHEWIFWKGLWNGEGHSALFKQKLAEVTNK